VRIFPILASGDESKSVPFGFITAQWIDIRQEQDYNRGLRLLISAMQTYLGIEQKQPDKSEKAASIPPPASWKRNSGRDPAD
jgi:hypothetical protein